MIDFIAEHAKIIALIGFFTAFVWIFISVMRPARKKELEEHAYIPLKEVE